MSLASRMPELPIAAAAGAMPAIALLNNKAMVPLSAGIALLLLIYFRPSAFLEDIRRISPFVRIGALFLVAHALLSVLWAPDINKALVSWGKFTGNVVLAAILLTGLLKLEPNRGRVVLLGLAIGSALALAYLMADALSDGAVTFHTLQLHFRAAYGAFWFKAGANVLLLSLIAITAFMMFSGRMFIGILLLVCGLYVSFWIGARTGAAGLIGGAILSLIYLGLGQFRTTILRISFISLFAMTPVVVWMVGAHEFASQYLSGNSSTGAGLIYRLHIWDFTVSQIAESWFTGWGLGASRHFHDAPWLVDPLLGEIGQAMPLHPHNVALQIWLELGLVGVISMALFLFGAFAALRRLTTSRAQEFFVFTWVFTVLALAAFSYSLWSSWWLQSIALTLGFVVLGIRQATPDGPSALASP